MSLSDHQLSLVMHAARVLAPEKRDALLQRVAANLLIRCGRASFTDADVAFAAQAALRGLVHEPAA